MSRQAKIAILTLTVLIGLTLPSAVEAAQQPFLGWAGAFHYGKGFGSVKPRHVYLGGDATGDVRSIAWHDWGHRRAVGYGTGWCPGISVALGHPCPVALRTSSIGLCHGRRAYRTVAFYFKTGSSWMFGSRWNVCRGQAVNS